MTTNMRLNKPLLWLAILALLIGAIFIGSNTFSNASAASAPAAKMDEDDDINEVDDDDEDEDEDEVDVPITGDALDLASSAALEYVGEGTVTEAEIENDEEGYYEVEVMLDDGSEVEVYLDEQFNVLGHEND